MQIRMNIYQKRAPMRPFLSKIQVFLLEPNDHVVK